MARLDMCRALHIYMDRTEVFRQSDTLYVSYGIQNKGRRVSKSTVSHWVGNVSLRYMSHLAQSWHTSPGQWRPQ